MSSTTNHPHMITMNAGNATAGPAMEQVTNREQSDRIRAAFINGLGRTPGTYVVADRGCAWDLAAAVAVLAWEGEIIPLVRDLTIYGCLGLDGRVTDGVVSDGTTATPIHHIADVVPALNAPGFGR